MLHCRIGDRRYALFRGALVRLEGSRLLFLLFSARTIFLFLFLLEPANLGGGALWLPRPVATTPSDRSYSPNHTATHTHTRCARSWRHHLLPEQRVVRCCALRGDPLPPRLAPLPPLPLPLPLHHLHHHRRLRLRLLQRTARLGNLCWHQGHSRPTMKRSRSSRRTLPRFVRRSPRSRRRPPPPPTLLFHRKTSRL